MIELPLPEESDAQRIGHNADKCFTANCPNSWRPHSLDGTDDAGFDYQIQIVNNGRYRDIFRVQLKGTESPSLNASGEFFSIALKGRTLNYYARVTEPILLVLCDLSVDPSRPAFCPLYYVWIHEEIRRHRDGNAGSDHQASLTIRIPKSNLLTPALDLSPEIAAHRRIYAAAKALDQAVEEKLPAVGPETRADILEKISGGFAQRASSLIEQMSAPVRTPWPEAPRNSIAGKLNDTAQKLALGLTSAAQAKLSEISTDLNNATKVERAEYWYLRGKQYSQEMEELSARDAYKCAYDLAPATSKYKVAWIETEFRARFKEVKQSDFSDLKAVLDLSIVEEVTLHARILSVEGQYDEAIHKLNTISRNESLVTRAMLATTQSQWLSVVSLCDEGLGLLDNKDDAKQLFYLFRARAKFHLAISKSPNYLSRGTVPTFGPSNLDLTYLNEAWSDIEAGIEMMRLAGWPTNIDYFADIWGSACLMLGKEKETLKLIEAAARCRSQATGVQLSLERVAMQCGKWDIALNANSIQPQSAERTLRRIVLLYQAQHYSDCVELVAGKIDSLPRNHEMFPLCISLGVLAADEVVRPDISSKWIAQLRDTAECNEHIAILEYHRAISQNILTKDEAVNKLEVAYYDLNMSKTVGLQLFHALDAFDVSQAERCIKITRNLSQEQQFSVEAELHLAQAYTTLGKWDLLFDLVNEAEKRFTHIGRFQAIRAFALDKLGYSADALQQLREVIDESDYDAVAVNSYINIATRCGFSEEAISLVERMLGQEANNKKQFELLRTLFALVHSSNPHSQRAEEIAWRLGFHTRRDVEEEEGVFILMYLTATLSASVSVTPSRRDELHRRIKEFTSKFPDSKIFRVGTFSEGASPDEMLNVLYKLVGKNTKSDFFRKKISSQLESGEISLPFAWRPRNVLEHIPDVAALWQVAKGARRDARQYHLNMVLGERVPVSYPQVQGKIPIFDLATLFVLADLKIFDIVFSVFPKIAISQKTLLELQRLAAPMVGSWARDQCRMLNGILKNNIKILFSLWLQFCEAKKIST